jgi:hypothetical protein
LKSNLAVCTSSRTSTSSTIVPLYAARSTLFLLSSLGRLACLANFGEILLSLLNFHVSEATGYSMPRPAMIYWSAGDDESSWNRHSYKNLP